MARRKTLRQRECGSKNAFRTKAKAEDFAARLIVLENNANGPTLMAYCCRFCNRWHVGHRSRRIVMRYNNADM